MSARPGSPRRRQRLRLEAPVQLFDPLGGRLDLWQDAGAIWAQIERRPVRQTGPVPVPDIRITLLWRPGLTAGMRLSGSAGIFLIRAVIDPDARRHTLLCLCREVTS